MTTNESLIQLLKENEVIKYGEFILSSGKESDYYIDIKKGVTNPKILRKIATLISEKIDNEKIHRVAGPALGAVPIATAISLESKIPFLMIRKGKKDYGTSKQIEGEINSGDSVLVVEDVTTTGASIFKAIESIEAVGGIVKKVCVVVDREEGAVEFFKSKNIELESLISVSEFIKNE
ncbi:MAG: orotate phosphoribosyltransferase [Methanobrevibacter sp.]|jgi:orotate phosphoribosyltransferase|nr:orotate phosphoribosyltransferase [Candidatus Methanovirga aequatorialis]